MSAQLIALGTTALFAALFTGAGTLVTFRLDGGSLLFRLSLRLAVGMALVPAALIALYELAGLRVSVLPALVLGVAGLALLAVELRSAPPRPRDAARRDADLALLLLALAVFFACLRGSQRLPTFEGRDPWGHALGIQYVMDVGVLRQPDPGWPQIQYVDAYPPLFDVLMALPCKVAGSLNAPVKAMNALVVGAVNLLFAALVFELTRDRARTLAATVFFAALPGNLTRHVWGHSVAVLFLFAGLVAALRARESPRWIAAGAVCFAGGLLAAPSQGIASGALLVVTAAGGFALARAFGLRLLAMGALALALSLVWFGPVFQRYGTDPTALASAMQHPELRRSGLTRLALAEARQGRRAGVESPFAGAAPRRYGLDDFLFFRPYAFVLSRVGTKQMNETVPEGLGVAVFVLSGAALGAAAVRRLRRAPFEVGELAVLWLAVSLAGLLGPYFGLRFFTWRFWLMVCPFACLAAAQALGALSAARRTRFTSLGIAALLGLLLADVAAAVVSDAFGPGPWRYIPQNLPFLVLPVAAALWFLIERPALPRAWLVGSVLAAHLVVAGPARLRLLTRNIPPKGFYDEVEHAGYLRVREATPPGATVFSLSGGLRFEFLAGLDRICRPYLSGERDFLRRHSRGGDPLPTADVVAWLRTHGYRYAVLDPSYRDQDPALFETRAAELAGMAGVTLVFRLRGEGRSAASQVLLFELR